MSKFDLRAQQIKQRRQLAEAIRASGNEPLDYTQQAGRFVVPVSPWQHADKALKQFMGAYETRLADKDEKKLVEEQQKAQADWIAGLTEAQTPDEVQPIASTGELIAPTMDDTIRKKLRELNAEGEEVEQSDVFQQQQANRAKAVNTYSEATKASDSADKKRMLAFYMSGGELGGMPAQIGAAGMERELFPAPKKIERVDLGDRVGVYENGRADRLRAQGRLA